MGEYIFIYILYMKYLPRLWIIILECINCLHYYNIIVIIMINKADYSKHAPTVQGEYNFKINKYL